MHVHRAAQQLIIPIFGQSGLLRVARGGVQRAVTSLLIARGHPVVAAANPLSGLRSDSDFVATIFHGICGPIVAVGHSYAGSVITNAAAGNPQVKALVYVAAFAPESGESAAELSNRFPGSTLGPALAAPVALPGGGMELYIEQEKFHAQFAADVPEAEAKLMAVMQRPIVESALHDPAETATWRSVPSWFIFGSLDKNIPAAAHAFMAKRANAKNTVEIEGASHVVMMSHPDAVSELINQAAEFVGRKSDATSTSRCGSGANLHDGES